MNTGRSILGGGVLVVAAAVSAGGADAATPARAALPRYHVINLGYGWGNEGGGINRAGQVVFRYLDNQQFVGEPINRSALYDHGKITPITMPGVESVEARGINERGEVVGEAVFGLPGAPRFNAFRWSAGAGMRELRAPAGSDRADAAGINDHGVVVGNAPTAVQGGDVAVRWGADAAPRVLATLGSSMDALAINDSGQVAGEYTREGGSVSRVFFWTPRHGAFDIGTLGGGDASFGAMNAAAQIAGTSSAGPDGASAHAFLWTPWRKMLDLGNLGGTDAAVRGMNDAADVVGYARTPDGHAHAFYWRAGHGMRDLGTFGGIDSDAYAINAQGLVVGWCTGPFGIDRGFAWREGAGGRDLNSLVQIRAPGLLIGTALTVGDTGAILALSSAGLVLLEPGDADGPVAGPLQVSFGAPASVPATASVRFVDPAHGARYRAQWTWGDGSPASPGAVNARNGRASGSHRYSEPGSYKVVLTLSDNKGHQAVVSNWAYVCTSADGVNCDAGELAATRRAISAAATSARGPAAMHGARTQVGQAAAAPGTHTGP